MNEVLQAIIDYVRTPKTDHALMIDAPWGAGKTHFWRKVVAPCLADIESGRGVLRPLYASLFGCESVKDISTQLFLSSYPVLRKKWMSRFGPMGWNLLRKASSRMAGFDLPDIDLRAIIDTRHTIICFDDLERCSLGMRDILGYINSYVEHDSVKAVLLTDEDRIPKEEKNEPYWKMKEKLVGVTLRFRADPISVVSNLVAEHRDNLAVHAFLLKNDKLIMELFERSKTNNFRAMRRALSAMSFIHDALLALEFEPDKIAHQLLFAVLPATFELHGRNVKGELLLNIYEKAHLASLQFVRMMKLERTDEQSKYEDEFAERYLEGVDALDAMEAVGCPAICHYLITGVLDRAKLSKWADSLIRPPDPSEERLRVLSSDPFVMEDQKFVDEAAKILDEIRAGAYKEIAKYFWSTNTIFRLIEVKLIRTTLSQVREAVEQGLAIAEKAGRLEPNAELDWDTERHADGQWPADRKEVLVKLQDTNDRLIAHQAKVRVLEAAGRMDEHPEEFMWAIANSEESGLKYVSVLPHLDINRLAQWLIKLPNSLKLRFRASIRKRYEFVTDVVASEAEHLTELAVILKDHTAAQSSGSDVRAISTVILDESIPAFEDAAARIRSQSERNAGATEG